MNEFNWICRRIYEAKQAELRRLERERTLAEQRWNEEEEVRLEAERLENEIVAAEVAKEAELKRLAQ